MQNSRCSHTDSHTRGAYSRRGPDTGTAKHLSPLIDTHPDTNGPNARTHARAQAPAAKAHPDGKRSHRNTHAHTCAH